MDQQLQARSFFINIAHPVLGRIISQRFPWKGAQNLFASWKPAPMLGEDNDYVFRKLLGMEERELSLYREKGIIG